MKLATLTSSHPFSYIKEKLKHKNISTFSNAHTSSILPFSGKSSTSINLSAFEKILYITGDRRGEIMAFVFINMSHAEFQPEENVYAPSRRSGNEREATPGDAASHPNADIRRCLDPRLKRPWRNKASRRFYFRFCRTIS